MRDHRPKTTDKLMEKSGLANIQQRAVALAKLNKTMLKHLPPEAQAYCHIANYRNNTLIIEVASSAWLTRLNYQRLDLISKLRYSDLPSLVSIELKINPSLMNQTVIKKQTEKKREPISEQSAEYLRMVAENAPEKIKVRLERIAAMSQKKK
ncbi:DciA family protein [Vibrio sp. SS-MA-C1-2]|uniref:DUF721 domain-containing protein n=1 Tax=Vibrio sp. SS-MA-C1-2 TaxID=2908646 RepID=UPI001F33A840|nr:DciA family protein [Vibrio sp. SS-MA-C1-2]UJF19615.1 DciA family protein [Vibrio sp. SS-MA-C1-2]